MYLVYIYTTLLFVYIYVVTFFFIFLISISCSEMSRLLLLEIFLGWSARFPTTNSLTIHSTRSNNPTTIHTYHNIALFKIISECRVTREALRESDEVDCPFCHMKSLLHDSEAKQLERFRINAEIKKEEIKANAKVLPFLHDFVYNSINFFPFFLESQKSISWIVLLSPFMDIFKLSSLGSSHSPQAPIQISSSPTSSPYSFFSSPVQCIHGFEMHSCHTTKESRTGMMAKKKDS